MSNLLYSFREAKYTNSRPDKVKPGKISSGKISWLNAELSKVKSISAANKQTKVDEITMNENMSEVSKQ